MQHMILAIITMGVVWYAWTNFKKIGRLRLVDLDLTPEERQQRQVTYVMRIVMCLILLAILPFLFTFLIK
ncbi:MAG: hypothetical protein RIR53_1530 [Bacteroidota bacterium]|jgi:phosphotransferase system  glucose/maltose/N-acetylglucosamine-specific IIC component